MKHPLVTEIAETLKEFTVLRRNAFHHSRGQIIMFVFLASLIIGIACYFVYKNKDFIQLGCSIVAGTVGTLTAFGVLLFKPHYDNQMKIKESEILIRHLENCELGTKEKSNLFFTSVEAILNKFYK